MAKKRKLRRQRTELLAERLVDKAILRSCADFAQLMADFATMGTATLCQKYGVPNHQSTVAFVKEQCERIREMASDAGYTKGVWPG